MENDKSKHEFCKNCGLCIDCNDCQRFGCGLKDIEDNEDVEHEKSMYKM